MASLFLVSACFGQQTARFNLDSLKVITKVQFDRLVDTSISLLQTRKLSDIPDSGHINIMMCLNTIFMAYDTIQQKRFRTGRYAKLEQVAELKKYDREIIRVYPEWIPNRGMGFYFPKLRMELYGTPRLYAWFQVEE